MKKRILKIISLILILAVVVQTNGFGLFAKKTTYAAGDLNITWNGVPDGDPIFVVNNMLPGDMEDRDVDVANGGTVPRDVGVRGVKTEEIASFAAVLDFIISENGTDLYGGSSSTGAKTLQEFFDDSGGPNGLFLSTINNGDSTTYNFKATFPEGSGNEFQGAKVVFDLIIGIVSEIPEECSEIEFSGSPIFGTSGDDVIRGTHENDLIFALEGTDKVFAWLGDDCIVGGSGNDELRGETGDDIIFGNEGDDLVIGAVGQDLLFGGTGNDTVKGENGEDVMFGNEGNDTMKGGNGNDQMNGNEGNDNMNGENGTDNASGDEDDDTLVGGNGQDTLVGNDGSDSANGQNGTDTCDAEIEVNCEL